jgi:hypothetical protein
VKEVSFAPVAHGASTVAVRDSKAPARAILTFPDAASASFLRVLKEAPER